MKWFLFIVQSAKSTPFIEYACEELFPLHTWKLIESNDRQQLRILRVFAELAEFCGELKSSSHVEAVLNLLEVLIDILHFSHLNVDMSYIQHIYYTF